MPKRTTGEKKKPGKPKRPRLYTPAERREILAKQWHSKNVKDFSSYTDMSAEKVWWYCDKSTCTHPHEWQASIDNRSRGSDCPFCNSKKICECNSVAKKHPEILKLWDYSKNVHVNPYSTFPSSRLKAWFWCKDCSCDHHKWEGSIATAIKGCPFCKKLQGMKYVCPCTSLAASHPEIAKEWHPTKNTIKIEQVTSRHYGRVWWKCLKHKTCDKHEWQSTVSNRIQHGRGCTYCTMLPCPCHNFAKDGPEDLLAEWHPSNKEPKEYRPNSNKIVKWQCRTNPSHPAWETSINIRMRGAKNCPACSETGSHGERKTAEALSKLVSDRFIRNNKKLPPELPELKNKVPLRFDFILLPEHGQRDRFCVIEYDGEQHFDGLCDWLRSPVEHDRLKNLYAARNKIHLLRIGYRTKHNFYQVISDFLEQVKHASPFETIIRLEGVEYTQEYRESMFSEA